MKIAIIAFVAFVTLAQGEKFKKPNGFRLDVNENEVRDIALQAVEDYNARYGKDLKHLVTLKSIDVAEREVIFGSPVYSDIKYYELTAVLNTNCPHSLRLDCNEDPKPTDFVGQLIVEAEWKGDAETGHYWFNFH